MNYIKAKVTSLQSVEKISIVTFEANQQIMSMMSLELNPKIQKGTRVLLGVKSTNITLARRIEKEISIDNQLPVKVTHINIGELLCSVTCSFSEEQIESVITATSAQKMKLKAGDEIVALIKPSELSILEVLS